MSITVVQGDIFEQDVDAIVNPANEWMIHSGGLARIIANRAGEDLVQESGNQIPVPTGEAIITTAGDLSFKAVVHTVGPDWRKQGPEESDRLLARAHRNAIWKATLCGLESLAFPAVSCGIFGFPVERAAPVAVQAVREALQLADRVERVVFCLREPAHYAAFAAALSANA